MPPGKTPETHAAGDAYDAWLVALREAGEWIRSAEAPATGLDRAEGIRYVTRLASTALSMFVENADPLHPALYVNADAHHKYGVDNPDNVYLRCAVDGGETYRLWGTRGEAPYFGITVGADFYGGGGARRGTLSQHHLDAFDVDDDGCFELILSPEEHPGNWIRLEPEATGFIVRQTFFDRRSQRPAELFVERIGGGPPPPLGEDALAAGLERAAAFVRGCTRTFLKMVDAWRRQPNQLTGASGASTRHLHGDPDLYYVSGYWRLAENEALVIDVKPAQRFLYWGFQLCNYWLESLDYEHRNVATNQHLADCDAGGGARLVVAHADPGVPNWIDTAGHREGAMCFRWLLAEDDPPIPEVRVVPVAELSRL